MRTFKVLLIVMVLAAGLTTAHAQDDPCMEKGGQTNPETGACEISVTLTVGYPVGVLGNDFAEQTIDQYLLDLRQNWFSNLTMFAWSPGPMSLYVVTDEYDFSETVISFKFTISDYTGGAHPNTFYSTLALDLEQNRMLTLDDLFQPGGDPLATIAPLVMADLERQLTEMGALEGNWIEDGTGMNAANYQAWAIDANSLYFFFSPYQIAAYAVGGFTVQIPLTDLSGILAAPFNGQ